MKQKKLLQKINDDEQTMRAVYEQKDTASLERSSTVMLVYINPNPKDMFDTYWIGSDALDLYVKFDTTLRNLKLYTGDLTIYLDKGAASLQNIAKKKSRII